MNDASLLTFEWDAKNETLEIHCDKQGLIKLKSIIETLLVGGDDDHMHLMTEDWGGTELSSQKQSPDNEIINHVKIYSWIDQNT